MQQSRLPTTHPTQGTSPGSTVPSRDPQDLLGNAAIQERLRATGGPDRGNPGGSGPAGAPPRPADRTPTGQPAGQPELADVEARWNADASRWEHGTVTYEAIRGEEAIDGFASSDVRQGALGDCYLMAALSSLAQTDPQLLDDAITPAGEAVWRVRLYRREADASFSPHSYTVDNLFPTDGDGNLVYGRSGQHGTQEVGTGRMMYDNPAYNDPLLQMEGEVPDDAPQHEVMRTMPDYGHHELWPSIIEKAYAMHAPRGGIAAQGERAGGYDDIGEGGYSDQAFEALAGRPAARVSTSELGGDALSARIRGALDAGSPLAAGTGGPSEGADTKQLRDGVYSNHAYTVVSLEGDQITLRNPWGRTYRSEDLAADPSLEAGRNDGVLTLSLDDFRATFDTLYIGTARHPVA